MTRMLILALVLGFALTAADRPNPKSKAGKDKDVSSLHYTILMWETADAIETKLQKVDPEIRVYPRGTALRIIGNLFNKPSVCLTTMSKLRNMPEL